MMDHIPRQDVIEGGVGKRQGVGEALVQAHRQTACRGRLAHHLRPPAAGDPCNKVTPMLYQPPGCPPQLAVMNKNGALYIYNRDAIGSGPMQVLQISVFNSSGVEGLFVGDPVYDPVLNLIYTGNSQD